MESKILTRILLLVAHMAVVRADITSQYCTVTLNGVMSGGRCFFFLKTTGFNLNVDWGQAWKECEKYNATLAQMHTTAEYDAVVTLIRNVLVIGQNIDPLWVWLGMQRDNNIKGTCAITNDTTFWYDGPTTPNTKMNAGNTWIRNHPCEDTDAGDEYYMAIRVERYSSKIQNWVWQPPSTYPTYPLCQITNCGRKYTKSITNDCLTEIPVEIFTVTQTQDCADACSSRMWCRSFEDFLDNSCAIHTCKLFPWSSTDLSRPGITSSNPNCIHYDSDLA